MSLAALSNNGPARKLCVLGAWVQTLTDTERDALTGMLADQQKWSHKRLAEAISADEDYPDVTFTADRIRRHRNNDCACKGTA